MEVTGRGEASIAKTLPPANNVLHMEPLLLTFLASWVTGKGWLSLAFYHIACMTTHTSVGGGDHTCL